MVDMNTNANGMGWERGQMFVPASGGASYRQGRAYSPTIFVQALPQALPLGQEAKKSKISVVHSLAVKGHREWLSPGPRSASPDPLAGAAAPSPRTPSPLSAIRASNLSSFGLAH